MCEDEVCSGWPLIVASCQLCCPMFGRVQKDLLAIRYGMVLAGWNLEVFAGT